MKTKLLIGTLLSLLFTITIGFVTTIEGQKRRPRTPPKKTVTSKVPKVGDVIKNSLGMEFSWIPAGSFMMGSSDQELKEVTAECQASFADCVINPAETNSELPMRRVTISQGFWMGRYKVTQDQFVKVMGRNPSLSKTICGANCPVENLTWFDAKEFIRKLNENPDGFVYSLPSEAEWEYAARAGTRGLRYGELEKIAWYGDNSGFTKIDATRLFYEIAQEAGPADWPQRYAKAMLENGVRPKPVGGRTANAWGLFDMIGNVKEWVEDIFSPTGYGELPADGTANSTKGNKDLRVLRGCGFMAVRMLCRSADRHTAPPSLAQADHGLRVVLRRDTDLSSGNPVNLADEQSGRIGTQAQTTRPGYEADQILWNEISKQNTKESYEFYLGEQPKGAFAAEARRRITALDEAKEKAVWDAAVLSNRKTSFESYLKEYPKGRFITQANEKIKQLERAEEDAAWNEAGKKDDVASYTDYLKKFPTGVYAAIARLRLQAKGVTAEAVGATRTNSIGMEFSWIPAGSFMMGSTDAQIEEAWKECKKIHPECPKSFIEREKPQRLVTIPEGFWMGRYEVTQGQYEAVMGTNPSEFRTCGKDCPVEQVSWNDAKEFISKLNARNDGFVYSLPSEAEWEYAARAGTTTAFAFGNSLSSIQANFDGNYPYGNEAKGSYLKSPAKVGSYRPNAWGLYDMHGNIGEWVDDIYQDSYTGLPTDGSSNTTFGDTSFRVFRGGAFGFMGNSIRSASRGRDLPSDRFRNLGFRIVARAKNQQSIVSSQ